MKKTILLSTLMLLGSMIGFAQDEDSPLTISGSVDTYYKYQFSQVTGATSFAQDVNSFSIGMANIILSK